MQFRAPESAGGRSAKVFPEIFYSRIDNARLNFTLGIPQKFFGLKNSGRVLENRYAFDRTYPY